MTNQIKCECGLNRINNNVDHCIPEMQRKRDQSTLWYPQKSGFENPNGIRPSFMPTKDITGFTEQRYRVMLYIV